MESGGLSNIWQKRLNAEGWSHRACEQLSYVWAKSTKANYECEIKKLKTFCLQKQLPFPPDRTGQLADFLCYICDCSDKPRATLRNMEAAVGNLYRGLGKENLMSDPDIKMLLTALVKSGTTEPMKRTSVMPVEPFVKLFTGWPNNEELDIKRLRLKAITLLALTLFLRPSDIAPRAVSFDPITQKESRVVFSRDMVDFNVKEGVQITLFGIKNDLHRQGFKVKLPSHSNVKLDPVSALQHYIVRTESSVGVDNGVFLSLHAPYHALQADTVGHILEEAIHLCGLPRYYTAKYFRPTGATLAIESGQDPEIVRKIGRWKSSQVFYEHYVHSRTPDSLVSAVLSDNQA